MDKKIRKYLVLITIAVIIIVIFSFNILIKKYEKESLISVPQETKENVLKEERVNQKVSEPVQEESSTEMPSPVYPKGTFLN